MEKNSEKMFDMKNLAINRRHLYKIRILFSICLGCAAGILGVQKWEGATFFLLGQVFIIALLLVKFQLRWNEFFIKKTDLVFEGLSQGVMTYLLFWILAHNLVHIY
eukprot:GCRY01001881.1.p1 GENE.GCRY01001881.1~~GCRY01001881.1.p1  ORF type:complete len:106 (-),score=14.95 GCRY01001881.1:123-440(-)